MTPHSNDSNPGRGKSTRNFYARLRLRLLRWYDANKRDLPWRRSRDPYRIWVSEIMLQQTRVGAVLAHYDAFLSRFPDVSALARARANSVLAAWSGLGYYRRARAMHACARELVRNHGGEFPRSREALCKLPGIGRYTSAAIASIAFGEACAVLDGNVKRVLRRLLAMTAPTQEPLWSAAERLLSRARPGDFNQAMMELGATVCLPKLPRCPECPIAAWCATRGADSRKKNSAPQLKQEVAFRLAVRRRSVFLVKRSNQVSVMPGMWELPQMRALRRSSKVLFRLRHSITNTDYLVTVMAGPAPRDCGAWVTPHNVRRLPLTGLTRKILRRANLIQ
jgi:A/G-specific adenine glycosylase